MLQRRGVPIAVSDIGGLVLSVPAGDVQVIAGLEAADLRQALDVDCGVEKVCLFVECRPASELDAIIAEIVEALAAAALASWPYWLHGADFSDYRGNTLEVNAAALRFATLARDDERVSVRWANLAAALANEGRPPRVRDCAPAVEVAQLSLAIAPPGLVIAAAGAAHTASEAAAFVQAVEWTARKANAAMVVLCRDPADLPPPFDRLLYNARMVDCGQGEQGTLPTGVENSGMWLAPVIGRPHPLSETEQRLAAALARDPELRALFAFNQIVRTLAGSCPRVDLLWNEGRLVVELDGYADHSRRSAFAQDRHRDYELLLSGYAVLRIANDETAVDIARAVEKIRDVVRLRRAAGG